MNYSLILTILFICITSCLEVNAQGDYFANRNKVQQPKKTWYDKVVDNSKKKTVVKKSVAKNQKRVQVSKGQTNVVEEVVKHDDINNNHSNDVNTPVTQDNNRDSIEEQKNKRENKQTENQESTTVIMSKVEEKPQTRFTDIEVEKNPDGTRLLQIEQLENSTLLYMEYTVPEGTIAPEEYTSLYIDDGAYLRSNADQSEYHLINSFNIPITSEAEYKAAILDHTGQRHRYVLEFEKIPLDDSFDMIESPSEQHALNLYNIRIHHGNKKSFVEPGEFVKNYPVKEFGRFIKDDQSIYYVRANGIIVTLGVSKLKKYGKYYSVNMDLKNYSGKSILFTLDHIKVTGYKGKKTKSGIVVNNFPMEILTAIDYDKRVKRTQAWNNVLVGLAEGLSAANAGYSSSTTTYSGHSSTHASAYAYGSSGWAQGYGSSYTSTYGKSHTTSYDGAAAYWAQQQAAANTAAYANAQQQIRNQLKDGYVKTNTIQNLVEYSGYFNIKYKDIDNIKIIFTFDGVDYPFNI